MTVLPYYMHATGLTQGFLGKALTAITEPLRRGAALNKCVARINMCGTHERKGLGIIDPHALDDAATKVTTLLRLLAGNSLVAAGWEALQAKPRLQHAHIPALHTGAARGLLARPRGEPALHIIRASRDLTTMAVGDLVPALCASGASKAYRALAAMEAGTALLLAAPRQTLASAHTTGAPQHVSAAVEDIPLTGGATISAQLQKIAADAENPQQGVGAAAAAPLAGLLTPAGLRAVALLRNTKGRAKLAATLAHGLLRHMGGPANFTFAAHHVQLVHATRHAAHTTERPRLASTHVGVDGSLCPAADGTPKAAGAAAYYVHCGPPFHATQCEAHIATCTSLVRKQ